MKIETLIEILEAFDNAEAEVEFDVLKFPSLGVVLIPYEHYAGKK
jgi:hypothetical protein